MIVCFKAATVAEQHKARELLAGIGKEVRVPCGETKTTDVKARVSGTNLRQAVEEGNRVVVGRGSPVETKDGPGNRSETVTCGVVRV